MIPATAQWMAIAFDRTPSGVHADCTLPNCFDFANIPDIFLCPLTVRGFEIRKHGPGIDEGPLPVKSCGNGAVPVWIVSADDCIKALPGRTLDEPMAMPSLMPGAATVVEETPHPFGSAKQPMLECVASGKVPDGRTFEFRMTEAAGILRQDSIVLR